MIFSGAAAVPAKRVIENRDSLLGVQLYLREMSDTRHWPCLLRHRRRRQWRTRQLILKQSQFRDWPSPK